MGIVILSVAFFVCATWKLWKPATEPVIDWYYRLRMDYRKIRGKRKWLQLLAGRFGVYIPKGIIYRIERVQRLAGHPWQLSPAELVLLEILGGSALFVISLGLQNAKTQFYILIVLLMIWPFTKMQQMAKKRRVEAREGTRFLKRRLRQELHRGIPLTDAIQDVGKTLPPGDFGETYRRYIAQIHERPLRDIMKELRAQYEVPELDSLCTAIEYSDRHSPRMLVQMLDRQITEEAYRLEELIEERTEAAKPKMIGMVALSILWTLVLGGYFGYLALHDRAMTDGSIFFGL